MLNLTIDGDTTNIEITQEMIDNGGRILQV